MAQSWKRKPNPELFACVHMNILTGTDFDLRIVRNIQGAIIE
jgi:hypothetical protein